MLKIGVMGAGAIGCYVGGRLAADSNDVLFVGRERIRADLEAAGLTLTDVAKDVPTVTLASTELRVVTDPALVADRDIVLVCVKSEQTLEVGELLAPILRSDALVVSLQNGVRNADVLRKHFGADRVLGGIVSFNVVPRGRGGFRRATTGPIVIEASPDLRVSELGRALSRAGFEVELPRDIRPQQWSKLVMNLNNAVSALTDAPTQRLLFDEGYRRILGAIMNEALGIIRAAGIRPERVGPVPAQLFPWMLRLPTRLLRWAARLQMEIDPEARSSMWEDLLRGRATEVDHLNGEIVRLATSCRRKAPLNERIVELVHRAERDGRGSPKMSADELWEALGGNRSRRLSEA